MTDCVVGIIPAPFAAISPGFQFGRAGDVAAGTYLQVMASVPTNTAGVIVPLDGTITKAYLTCETVATFTVTIQTRSGAVFTDIGTITLTAARAGDFELDIEVSQGAELAAYLSSGSGRNIAMGLSVQQAT